MAMGFTTQEQFDESLRRMKAPEGGMSIEKAVEAVRKNLGVSSDFDFRSWSDIRSAIRAVVPLLPAQEWQDISTAPKDGTKIDLLFPGVRGRTINCFWQQGSITPEGGWIWRSPLWGDGGVLLPESKWHTNCYPNMLPTHWMPVPASPLIAEERTK